MVKYFLGDLIYLLKKVDQEKRPIKDTKWRRISPGGPTPGLLANISMTEANGMIYVFGSSLDKPNEKGAPKSVLWIYNTSKKN